MHPPTEPAARPASPPLHDHAGPADCAVIGNGLPKSGTYMLHALLRHLGGWADTGLHINNNGYLPQQPPTATITRCPIMDTLARLRPGQIVSAHLAHDPDVDAALSDSGFAPRLKHVLMLRDPRDLIVSWMRFATHSEAFAGRPQNHPVVAHLRNECADDAERLHYAINERGTFPYRRFFEWMESPGTHCVRFDRMHAALEAAGRGELHDTLHGVLAYLGVDPAAVDLPRLHSEVFGNSLTSMRDKFKASSFREAFDDSHHAAIDTPFWREAVAGFGYAW